MDVVVDIDSHAGSLFDRQIEPHNLNSQQQINRQMLAEGVHALRVALSLRHFELAR